MQLHSAANCNEVVLFLRPGAKVLLCNEAETVFVDERGSHTFIGRVYREIMTRMAETVSRREMIGGGDNRQRAIRSLALARLVGRGVLVEGLASRRNYAISDWIINRGALPSWVRLTCDDNSETSTRVVSQVLAEFGVSVTQEQACQSGDEPSLAFVTDPNEYLSASFNSRIRAFLILPTLTRTVVSPALAGDPAARDRQVADRIAALTRGSPPTASYEGFFQLGLRWGILRFLKWASTKPHATFPAEVTVLDHESLQEKTRTIFGIDPVNLDDFRYNEDTRKVKMVLPHQGIERFRRFGLLEWATAAEKVVDPLVGVIPYVQNFQSGPVTVAITLHSDGFHQKARLASKTGYMAASGKGFDPVAARVGCIGEAVERFCCQYEPSWDIIRAPLATTPTFAVSPTCILKFSETQYRDRENVEPSLGFNWVPPRYQAEEPISWVRGLDLIGKTSVLLPAALSFFNFRSAQDHIFGVADSNGCASGSSINEAILHGLLEIIERDACSIWWYNRIQRKEICFKDCPDADVTGLILWLRRSGKVVTVLDISTEFSTPVCAAISCEADGSSINLGLGAGLDYLQAVRRSLLEMQQVSVVDLAAMPDQPIDPVQKDIVWWRRNARLFDHQHLKARGLQNVEWMNQQFRDVDAALHFVLNQFSRRGLPVYALNVSRSDLPMRVVRTFVPPMRHFWSRLAPGRLFDVPVAMGWSERPTAEADLNPIPFFL